MPRNLEGVVYAPTEPIYAMGGPSGIHSLKPRSLLRGTVAGVLVERYEQDGTTQRGTDRVFGVLTSEDRLRVTRVCHVSNSAFEGLVAYGEVLTGPLRGHILSLHGVVTVGNTGVEVMEFSSRMRELQERRDAGEPLDFSYYQADERYLVPVEDPAQVP